MPDQNAPASGFQYGLANLKPAEPEMKVALTFPDGAKREYPKDITGLELAKGISPSLAKRTVAMALDGVVADLNDPISQDAKIELIDAIPGDEPIKIYFQGDWFDLCRGPHMTSTGKVGNAFKLMKVAGAYWRGDSNNPMLTRIYGTAFAKQEELDAYLKQIEEAEKRDHRRLGRELDLFHFQEEGPGVVFWHPKGWTILQQGIVYMRRRLAGEYSEVNAPQILDKALWETSGHWDWYRENMFAAQSAGDEAEDKRWFALKPMNCPGHVQIFKHGLKSYRDLPLRLAEFGVVHRYEPSGAMHGLMRVRGFTQDDAHVFCTEQQLADECLKINDLILSTYADFGFEGELTVKLSTRPDKRVGTDEMWDHAERVMATVHRSRESGR